jgi:hypothetical protein
LGYFYVIHPLLLWVVAVTGSPIKPPALIMDEHLYELMFGMLGLGAMRSFREGQGAA